jgi:hypothetical protein
MFAGMGGSLRARWTANDVILDIDRQAERDNRELTPEESAQIHEATLRWNRLTTTATITGTIGAAALITGAVLVVTGLRPRVSVSPWGDRTSAGLSVSGRF